MINKTILKSYGPWALITGASSGIGAEFARQLGENGFNLVLVARRLDRLNDIKREIQNNHHNEIIVVGLDLSAENFFLSLQPVIEGLDIGLLINNAGFSQLGFFLENSLDREVELLHVNCRAPLILAHRIGNTMLKREQSGMIFVSSIAAMIPSPPWTGYAASKAYSRVIGECLAHELSPHHIDVLVLCPGGTDTEFQQKISANSRKAGGLTRLAVTEMKASTVVQAALCNLGKKTIVIPGYWNFLMAKGSGLFPRKAIIQLTAYLLQRMKLME